MWEGGQFLQLFSNILLPSAVHLEERLTVSEHQLAGKQAGGQKHRNTQFGFFQWQTRLQAVGRALTARTRNGRMAMQLTKDL